MNTPSNDRRFLVAWGGDAASRDALALGTDLATTFRTGLDALYVLHEESAVSIQHPGQARFRDEVEAQARAQLDKAIAKLPPDIDVRAHVRRSASVPRAVLDAAGELNARALVIGSGSRSKGAILANPLATAILHSAPVPVAMTPRGYRKGERGPLQELVAAVGLRAGAQRVVHEAVTAAAIAGLPLRLITLVDQGKRDEQLASQMLSGALAQLDAVRDEVGGDVDVTTEVGGGGNLRKAVAAIDWNPHSVLLVGSSRLAQGRQTFLGTTATRMLEHLPVPMIVVPRPN